MSPYDIFSFDTPSGKRHADPTEVIRVLRQATANRVDELAGKARLLGRLAQDPTLEDGSLNPDHYPFNPDSPDDLAALQEACDAHRVLVHALRAAFALAPFNPQTGEGATEKFCCELYNQFMDFLIEVQKKT